MSDVTRIRSASEHAALHVGVKGDSKKEADETFYLDLFGLSSRERSVVACLCRETPLESTLLCPARLFPSVRSSAPPALCCLVPRAAPMAKKAAAGKEASSP